jgi:biotin carboxyl carrier protein
VTDETRPADAVERAATLLPLLTDRLRRHGLGEIEVRERGFRLRVAGAAQAAGSEPPAPAAASDEPPQVAVPTDPGGVRAPAVGFFLYADGLGPGLDVGEGDALGHVEMLGVRHEVRAPRPGTVRHLVAESGEAVEYGQVLIEIEPARPASQ